MQASLDFGNLLVKQNAVFTRADLQSMPYIVPTYFCQNGRHNNYLTLRGLDTPGRFTSIHTWEITFMTSCLRSFTPIHFCKAVYFERKEFAPTGSKFFPFIVDLFSEGDKTILKELPSLDVHPFPFNNSPLHCVNKNGDCEISVDFNWRNINSQCVFTCT